MWAFRTLALLALCNRPPCKWVTGRFDPLAKKRVQRSVQSRSLEKIDSLLRMETTIKIDVCSSQDIPPGRRATKCIRVKVQDHGAWHLSSPQHLPYHLKSHSCDERSFSGCPSRGCSGSLFAPQASRRRPVGAWEIMASLAADTFSASALKRPRS